jgi:arsenite methyltransferase
MIANRKSIEVEPLRLQVQKEFTHREYAGTFEHSRSKMLELQYDSIQVDALPRAAVERFSGVGNPLSIYPVTPGSVIAEVGSGGGADTCLAAQSTGNTGHVFGIEMTQSLVDSSRQSVRFLGLRKVTIVKGYAESIALANQSADLVISNGLLHYCPDKKQVIREFYRILKSEGRIQMAEIVDSGRENSQFVPNGSRTSMHTSPVSEQALVEILRSVGFRDIQIHPACQSARQQDREFPHCRHIVAAKQT